MKSKTRIAATPLIALAVPALAHHAVGPLFDRSRIVEVEGEITEVLWRNPHIRLTLRGVDEAGVERHWDIETNSVSIVSRFGLTADLVDSGAHVRVAGNPGRASTDSIWLQNMLLPSGEEILFGARIEPRWSERTVGEDTRAPVSADPTGELGIFRVWTNAVAPPSFWRLSYPLTPAAAATQAAHDPIADDPTASCAPKGMPYIMEQPYPMALTDAGDMILMRLEEYDTRRQFAMTPEAAARAAVPARLGRSRGRWEGDELVVETTDIDYPYLNNTGIPQSPASHIEERFRLNADGSRLEYSMTITDPATFTEPVTLTKAWEWRPGEQVRPYNCL